MTDRPEPTTDGWVRFASQPLWTAARFAIVPDDETPLLVIEPDRGDTVRLELPLVTALDELLGGAAGHQHLELVVSGRGFAEVVWPPEFSDDVVTALEATVDGEPTGSQPTVSDAVPATARTAAQPVVVAEPVMAAEPVVEPVVEPEPVVDAEPEVDVRPVRSRSRASAGLIGTLALVGAGAVIVGALGLRGDDLDDTNIDIEVRTETTIRGTTTIRPTTSTSTTSAVTTTTVVSTPVATDCLDPNAAEAAEGCATDR